MGIPTPAAAAASKGVTRPCPLRPGWAKLPVCPTAGPFRATGDNYVRTSPPPGNPSRTARRPAAAWLFRLAAALAALTCALLASAAAVPAAWAVNVVPAGGGAPAAPVQGVATAGGMVGWQITLIAVGAALIAATAAVFLDRALAARRSASAAT